MVRDVVVSTSLFRYHFDFVQYNMIECIFIYYDCGIAYVMVVLLL